MNMKKISRWTALLLAGVILLSFAACKGKGNEKETTAPSTTLAEETSDEANPVVAEPIAWRMEVRGVSSVSAFTSEDAQYLPKVEMEMTYTTPEGVTLTNKYGGVTLRSILNLFGVLDVSNVAVVSLDGTTISYPQNVAMAEDTLLAWEVDGVPIDTEPPLRMCPRSGSADMYAKLVTAINVAPLLPGQTTTAASGSYIDMYPTYPTYSYPNNFPTYTYPVYTTKKTTTAKTTSGTGTTAGGTTTTDVTTATTTTTTTTRTTTAGSYVYTGPSRTTTTKTTTTASTASTTTVAPRPDDWPAGWPWP